MPNLPVARHDDDQLVRFFDGRAHEPQFRVDLPQLSALDGESRHQQRQHGYDRDGHRKILERRKRARGHREPQSVVNQRQQRESAER